MRPLCYILILVFVCLQLLSLGHHAPPNYDERASIDIALGVRPEYLLDSGNNLTLGFHYESVLSKSRFVHEDYARLRTVAKVLSGVMRDDSNGFLYYAL